MRTLTTILLFLLISSTCASESMIYGIVYRCNAEKINEAMVNECSKMHPSLAKLAVDNLKAWKARNLNNIKRMNKECNKSKTESDNELENVILSEIMQNMRNGAKSVDSGFCKNAISQLQAQGFDL